MTRILPLFTAASATRAEMKKLITRALVSGGVEQTAASGNAIGAELRPAMLIGLTGSLGAGKTNLTQGIGEGIEIPRTDIVSPTFTICVPHYGRLKLLHLDAYRIKHGSEVDELALDEELADGAVVIVEWVELIEAWLPDRDVLITIEAASERQRKITLDGYSAAGQEVIANVGERFAVT